MMQTWAILRATGRDPESRLGRKEKQRESGSMSLMAKKAMNGWRLKRNGCEFTAVPDEICSLPTNFLGRPKLSGISKRRESLVCSADGGERRIVDRWGDEEMSQDLLQEWTGSTRFRKSWWSAERTNAATSRGRLPAGCGWGTSLTSPRSKAKGGTSDPREAPR